MPIENSTHNRNPKKHGSVLQECILSSGRLVPFPRNSDAVEANGTIKNYMAESITFIKSHNLEFDSTGFGQNRLNEFSWARFKSDSFFRSRTRRSSDLQK